MNNPDNPRLLILALDWSGLNDATRRTLSMHDMEDCCVYAEPIEASLYPMSADNAMRVETDDHRADVQWCYLPQAVFKQAVRQHDLMVDSIYADRLRNILAYKWCGVPKWLRQH